MHRVILIACCAWLVGCQPNSSTPTKQIALSQDGAYIGSLSNDGELALLSSLYHGVALWDLSKQGLKYTWYQAPKDESFILFEDNDQNVTADNNFVFATAFSPSGNYALLADRHNFSLWDTTTGNNLGFWQIKSAKVQYRSKEKTHLYDVIDPDKCIEPVAVNLEGCEIINEIRAIDVSSQGTSLALGKSDGIVVSLNLNTGRRVELLGHRQTVQGEDGDTFHLNHAINSIDLSPNGRYLLTGSSDKTAILWDTQTAQPIHRFIHENRVVLVKLDDKGRYAFTADSQKGAKIWDLTNGKSVSKLAIINRQEIFTAARFNADGTQLLTGGPNRELILWDVKSGKQIQRWLVTAKTNSRPASAVIYDVNFSKDGRKVMSVSSAGLYEEWEVKHGS